MNAFQAVYTNFKPIPSRKVVSITLEAPIENGDAIIKLLGMPNPEDSKWVGVARLTNEAALSVPKAVSTPSAPNEEPSCKDADSKRTWDQLSYTERANKLIYNPDFHEFAGITPDQALDYVRGQCGVRSRTEILPDTEHARALDTLNKAFRDWQFEQRYS